jgi:hypothetical protein
LVLELGEGRCCHPGILLAQPPVFAASEIGEAVSGRTSRQESGLGILAEAIYAPWSAFVFHALLLQA